MINTMQKNRVDTRITGNNLEDVTRRRIALKNTIDVFP
jgi:hypothetical protein